MGQPAHFRLAQLADRFAPAKDLFDALANPLADVITRLCGNPVADRTATIVVQVAGNVRLDAARLKLDDQPLDIVGLVGAQAVPRFQVALAYRECRFALRRAGGQGGFRVDNQAMAVLP